MFFVSIYIFKHSFNYCIINKNKQILEQGKFDIFLDSFKKFKTILDNFKPCHIPVGSSGRFHIIFCCYFFSCGFNVFVVNLKTSHAFFQHHSSLNRSKIDKKIAYILVLFSFENKNFLFQFNFSFVKFLARCINSLTKHLAQFKTKLSYTLSVFFLNLNVSLTSFLPFPLISLNISLPLKKYLLILFFKSNLLLLPRIFALLIFSKYLIP